MKSPASILIPVCFALFSLHCSSTAPAVDMKEIRRVVGMENDVRVDAQLMGDSVNPNAVVHINYEIENLRGQPIAIADLAPETNYDPDSQTLTVSLGSETPGNLPKLVTIGSGQRRSFSKGARMTVLPAMMGGHLPFPRFVRVKVNFLGNVLPFVQALAAKMAARDLFPMWAENNEEVTTNSVPIHWASADQVRIGSAGGPGF